MKQFFKKIKYFQTLFLFILPNLVFADVGVAKNAVPLSGVAKNLMQPTSLLTELVYTACYIIGMALIIGSGVQYRIHRQNPMQAPLSRVLLWLIFGIAIFVLPFVAQWSESTAVFGKYQ